MSVGEWNSFYEFNYFEEENGSEINRITYKFNSTEMDLSLVLGKMEEFLISSGYDWVKPGSLRCTNSKHGEDVESKRFDIEDIPLELGEALKDALQSLKSKNNKEVYDRLSGLDRTAKVINLSDKIKNKKNIEEVSESVFTITHNFTQDELNWEDGYDTTITYGGIPVSELDFSEEEYEVDEKDNIILETEEKE